MTTTKFDDPLTIEADLQVATPVEIDTELARIHGEIGQAKSQATFAYNRLEHAVHDMLGLRWNQSVTDAQVRETVEQVRAENPEDLAYTHKKVLETHVAHAHAQDKVRSLYYSCEPFNAEFERRGGWTRAFLVVTSGQGHVHSSMSCSTCNKMGKSTQFHWMPEWSGSDEAAIVEAAGERACTVCYPTAPAYVLNRPTQMFTEDEKRKAAEREERAAKAREREQARVTLTVYAQDWRSKAVVPTEVTWKTTRALQNDLGAFVREYTGTYAMVNGFDLDLRGWVDERRVPVNREEGLHNIKVMASALAERGIDAEAIIAKNHKRATREGGTAWDGVL